MAKKVRAKKAKAVKASKTKAASTPKKKAVKAKKVSKPAPKKAKPVSKVVKKSKPVAAKKTAPKKAAKTAPKKATKVVAKKAVKPMAKKIEKKPVSVAKVTKPAKKVEPKVKAELSKPNTNGKSLNHVEKTAPVKNNIVSKPIVNTTTNKIDVVNKNISQIVKPANNGYVKPQASQHMNRFQTTSSNTTPKKPTDMANQEKTRYSDAELAEFKELILQKLEEKRRDLEMLKGTIDKTDDHGTDDTAHTFKPMEDGSDVMTKEEVAQLATRQKKIIQHLENALFRIENKTYGICRVSGKLIPKERLRSVPHATTTVEAKMSETTHE